MVAFARLNTTSPSFPLKKKKQELSKKPDNPNFKPKE